MNHLAVVSLGSLWTIDIMGEGMFEILVVHEEECTDQSENTRGDRE